MILVVQTSPDGTNWVTTDRTFRNRTLAKAWFDRTFVNPEIHEHEIALDWRVGFLVRAREGTYYRLVVQKTGKQVR